VPSQPPDNYERQFDFTSFSQTQPDAQQPGQQIDLELNEAQASINQTISRLNEIQRDDGKLRTEAWPGNDIEQQIALAQQAKNEAVAANAAAQAAKDYVEQTAEQLPQEISELYIEATNTLDQAADQAALAGSYAQNAATSASSADQSEINAQAHAQSAQEQAQLAAASAELAGDHELAAQAAAQAAQDAVDSFNPGAYIPQPAVAPVADQILGFDGTAWIAQDNFATVLQESVRNETGAVLDKGTVVYLNGVSGNKPLAVKSQANTEATSSKTFGVIAANIADNNNGYVVTSGLLKGLDTLGYTAGSAIWLSPTTPGGFTQTKPTAPNHAVLVGYVVRVHQTQGEVLVRIANGYELDELHDVLIASPATGQFLVRDGNLWKNQTIGVVRHDIAQGLGGASQSVARSNMGLGSAATQDSSAFAASTHAHAASDIFDFANEMASKMGMSGGQTGGLAVGGSPDVDKVIGFDGLYGMWVDRNPFNQSLDTTSSVSFAGVTVGGYGIDSFLGFTATSGTQVSRLEIAGLTVSDSALSPAPMRVTASGLMFPDGSSMTTAAAGASYDQSLNTYNDVQFQGLTVGTVDGGSFNFLSGGTLSGGLLVKDSGVSFFNVSANYTVGQISQDLYGIRIDSQALPGGPFYNSYSLGPLSGLEFWDTAGQPSVGLNPSYGVRFPDGTTQATAANLSGYAPLVSPALGGVPTAPTAAAATNTTQIATTAFVQSALSGFSVADASTTVKGIVELATSAEALAGTSETLAVTPKGLRDGLDSVVAAGGSGGVDIQIFGGPTSSGTFTWNKPLGAKTVTIKMVGAGGGGGSGVSAATTSARSGGGGGGAGASSTFLELADGLPNSVTVQIGAGGAGGAASSGLANPAGNGGVTTFGGFNVRHGLGSTGTGSNTSGTGAVFTQVGVISGASGAGTTTTGTTPTGISTGYLLPTGGGGGGGAAASSTTAAAGGAGGSRLAATGSPFAYNNALAGGAGGTTGGVAATNGSDQDTKFAGGTGGGGGAYITGQLGKAGGNGGWPGGGGGGGGASDAGFLSGVGGNGANGMVIVITTL